MQLHKSTNSGDRLKWINEYFDSKIPGHLAILTELVKNDTSIQIQEIAIEQIENQEILIEIIKNAGSTYAKMKATLKLTDIFQKVENLILVFRGSDNKENEKYRHRIAEELNNLYIQNLIPDSLKEQLLKLHGEIIKYHKDSIFCMSWCGGKRHDDYPTTYFEI